MITSCSPGWIKYCEHYYPEFLPNLSSCKSPHEMLGAVIKSYYAEKNGIDPKDIVRRVRNALRRPRSSRRSVPSWLTAACPDVDAVITTRELARMIKEAGIDFANLPDERLRRAAGRVHRRCRYLRRDRRRYGSRSAYRRGDPHRQGP